ncbi:unnamed protein product [marine sediment metagenome]|uniref:Uncharacterized protein n=1 Tax=marine sediment metagenome TaxID=412755 RepID=X1SNU9_9ZZZZ
MNFQGFGYRTNSRFADCVKVRVEDQKVTVSGPRVSSFIYRLWIIAQVVLLWSTIPMLLLGLLLWDWRYLVSIPGLYLLHYLVSALGAAILWSLANAGTCTSGKFPTVSFDVNEVKRVKIGAGWARNGLWFVIPEFIPLVNKVSEGVTVSFEAPDGDSPKDVTYAIQFSKTEDAKALAELLNTGCSIKL